LVRATVRENVDVSEPSEIEKLIAANPPPPRRRVPVLLAIAVISALVALTSFGMFFGGLRDFTGDWNDDLDVQMGRGGGIQFTVQHAWAYLVPLLVVLIASTLALFSSLIANVVRQGRAAARR
jgi:hypothetical protein